MPPKKRTWVAFNTHTGTLLQCASPPSAAPPNVTTSASMSPLPRLLIPLLCMRRNTGEKGRNLEEFMFGISVIEFHSYITVRKLRGGRRYKYKVGIRENTDPSLPFSLVFRTLSPISLLFYPLPLSPPLARWMINSQPESQQQLLADRPDMRIAA